jgi:hypothetical protein
VPDLDKQLKSFDGKQLQLSGQPPLNTIDGPGGWNRALEALIVSEDIPALTWERGLAKAAASHCDDLA